jgi:ABC-type branched-subunit amino acid transport system substrate-binding protein
MKKYSVILVLVALAVIIVGVYVGTKKDPQVGGFNVGLISILSGDYAAVGENFRNGVVLASEEYNAMHPDAQVQLFIEDDGFSGGKGVSAYQKLVTVDKIDALINVSTPTIDSIYESVTKSGIPVVQGGEQGHEPTDDNVFGIFPDGIASEYAYGVYMKDKGVREMTIVYTNIDAMIRFVEAFKKGFEGTTTDIVIDASEKDFKTHALKASAGEPENLGIFMFPQQGAQLVKEYLKITKEKPEIFFDTNFVSGLTDYERILSDLSVLDGSIVGGMKLDSTEAFKTAYKNRFGTEAGFLADIGYDAFNVLVSTRALDRVDWNKNIKNISFDGTSGRIQFGATGNRMPETQMMFIENGALVNME